MRHAQSRYNVGKTKDLNSEITWEGVFQTVLTAEYLKHAFPDLSSWECVVSPFKRTLQTARIIQEITGVKFSVDIRLHEYVLRYGRFIIPSLKEEYSEFDWSRHSEKEFVICEESNDLFMARIKNYISSLSGKYFLLTHCTPGRSMAKLLSGIDGYPDGLEVRNCSLSHIVSGKIKLFDHVIYPKDRERNGC